MTKTSQNRREFIKTAAATAAGLAIIPTMGLGTEKIMKPLTRKFGRLGFNVTTMGLGGQASIQWTPEGVDPVKIIIKAFDKGINYYDTSNLYGPSQVNFGKAFKQLNLIPGISGYDERKRREIFLASKTHLRYAKAKVVSENARQRTNGPAGSMTVDDLKRSLSQIFGDGQGNYPRGAYLDLMLIHNLTSMDEVDVLYEGLYNTDPKAENIGALAALRDYRDGTNLTGLNPKEEKLIKHLGFSGHHSPAVMMEMIQRDKDNLLEGMLIAINSNDLLNFNMQHNVFPIATAKNMGIIGMKVFADGAMYTKEARWSTQPEHVVRTVGNPAIPSRQLIQYALTTPGIHTLIIGIGEINDDPNKCQLAHNLEAAQIIPKGLNARRRQEIERMTASIKEGKTNYFQLPLQQLSAPQKPKVAINEGKAIIAWHTAYAGTAAIKQYEVFRDGQKIGTIKHQPQTSKMPFSFEDKAIGKSYRIVSVDDQGRRAETEELG
jgi:aryl-alcohol dehydrogenase-like predicted oxidoreductase